MRIFHHIEITKTGMGLSGGETCLLGLVQELRKYGHNIVYTSENGVDVYKKNGADSSDIEYVVIGQYEVEAKYGILASWFYKTWLARTRVIRLDGENEHVLISHSDFFPSVLFACWMKKRNPDMKWFAICHMLAPNPFKGNKWQFVKGKIIWPSLRGVYFWLSQRLFFRLQRQADLLISVNSKYKTLLQEQNSHLAIIMYSPDLEVKTFARGHERHVEQKYDLCFLGRFHEQKGVFEFVDVVSRIVQNGRPNFHGVMIGDYKNPLGDAVKDRIAQLSLVQNIEMVGLKMGVDKCTILSQSKVFLFPSYYESFGIVYLEAITLGIPVVEYDLPIYHDHTAGVVKVPYLDNDAMARAVTMLLDNPGRREQLAEEGRAYASTFDWSTAVETILETIRSGGNEELH
jgi:glycosyltransferase involved in cell wall biosynthesis